MKDVLIIANYIVTPDEFGNGRFNYIARELVKRNKSNVEVVSTNFSHKKKAKREEFQEFEGYKLTLLGEPGYKKNITLKRFYSHWVLSRNLKKYLNERKKPDIIYCAVPSLSFATVAATYAKKNNINFIIDIQDLWPEAFKMIFNPKIIGNLIYYPLKKQADYIYGSANTIIAVSKTYLKRGLETHKNLQKGYSIFLGNDLEKYEKLKENNDILKDKEKFWITYVGTLGSSYNLKIVIDALNYLQEKYKIQNIEFIILGDGPLKNIFENYSTSKNINAKFLGRVSFEKVVHYLDKSDLTVNPIMKGAAQSIINKVGDYAAAGKPVINTQECEEYRSVTRFTIKSCNLLKVS